MWAHISWEASWLIQGRMEPVYCQGVVETRDGPSCVCKAFLVTSVGSTETWRGGCFCHILVDEQTEAQRGDQILEDCKGKDLNPWLPGSLGGKEIMPRAFST